MSSVSLTQAVTSGDAGAVTSALANGADVNERTGGGQTALILATIFGHTHLIPILLKAGADPDLRDNLGLNAVDWAQRRGASEAIAIFKNKNSASTPAEEKAQTEIPVPSPAGPATRSAVETETPSAISAEERSRRWIAGLKQRIAELPVHDAPAEPTAFPLESQQTAERATPKVEPKVEPKATKKPEPVVESKSKPLVESRPAPVVESKREPVVERKSKPFVESKPALVAEPKPAPVVSKSELVVELKPEPVVEPALGPHVEPVARQTQEVSSRSSARKRCPKCNAIYNSDLVAYCAHHVVPLVDADAPPVLAEPQKTSPTMFWIIILITLSGSLVVGTLLTTYLYSSNKAATPPVAAGPPAATPVQKGIPAAGRELAARVVSLPVAECPLNGQEAIPGTVMVKVTIDKSGRVKSARASGGDWLLRGAATEAAMKSTFSERPRGRDTEGTITYTFEP